MPAAPDWRMSDGGAIAPSPAKRTGAVTRPVGNKGLPAMVLMEYGTSKGAMATLPASAAPNIRRLISWLISHRKWFPKISRIIRLGAKDLQEKSSQPLTT